MDRPHMTGAERIVAAGDSASATHPQGYAAPDGCPRLDLIDQITLQGKPIPEREWIVRNWIPTGVVSALYGDGGMGKSLLAQQLMTAVATGQSWLAQETARCKVLGVFCEDDADELHRRQAAISAALGVDFGDLENLKYASRVADDNILAHYDWEGHGKLTAFYEQLLDAAMGFGAQLVVLDTAADLFGGNEIVRGQVRHFVTACLGKIAQAIDGGVLLLAHPSRAGMLQGDGSGGSTAWNNSVRSRLYLTRPDGVPGQSPERLLTRQKANYAASGERLELVLNHGAFASKPNVAPDMADPLADEARCRAAEHAFLACLDVRNLQVYCELAG